MTLRPLFGLVLVALAACATPARPSLPPATPPLPAPTDDHRSVPAAEFFASPWKPLPAAKAFAPLPAGLQITLADGRILRLSLPAPNVVHWWIPAAPADQPSPGARYDQLPGGPVQVDVGADEVKLTSPGLTATVNRRDLSVTVVWGAQATPLVWSAPRQSGTRVMVSAPGTGWTGYGLDSHLQAHHWLPESPWALPVLAHLGGAVRAVVAVDSTAQSYTSADAAWGTLNGGLDLVAVAVPLPAPLYETYTSLWGRPTLPPDAALATALAASTATGVDFVRGEKLSIRGWAGKPFETGPHLRPWVPTGQGGLGTARTGWPEVVPVGSERQKLASVVAFGLATGVTPALKLDHPRPETLATFLLAPALTLDFGPDPAAWWSGLTDADRRLYANLLARRSEFAPLLTNLARASAEAGQPSWLPLSWAAPLDPQAAEASDEYLVGTGLLAALVPEANRAKVYLPGPGVWFDFWTGEELGGGRSYDRDVRPDRPLLFARGGAFVPVREALTYDGKDVYNPLTIHVFPGGRGTGTYRADDGTSLDDHNGGAVETTLVYDYSAKTMSLEHRMVQTSATVKVDPYVLYRLHNLYKPKSVKIDGKPIPLFGDSWGITNSDRSAAWYENDHTLLIKTFRPEREQFIEMAF